MTTIMKASHQWMTRPADERFVSLHEMGAKMNALRHNSMDKDVPSKGITAEPDADDIKGMRFKGPQGNLITPTHWAFGQMASLAGAPAAYLRKLPNVLAADCINYGLQVERDVSDVKVLLTQGEDGVSLRAATGPGYGRVWNAEIVDYLIQNFGDGVEGHFRVPGEFGQRVKPTRENTTLYASDEDMFVFLADEDRRVEMKDRRNGQGGSLARGFMISNSEVGAGSLVVDFFLFDYVCMNRIIWGSAELKTMRMRHTASTPQKWLDNIVPVLNEMAHASPAPIEETIRNAQAKRIEGDLNKFLKTRFTGRQVSLIKDAHEREEGREIETIWDAVTGITAYAKTIEHQNARVEVEKLGGQVLDLVAA